MRAFPELVLPVGATMYRVHRSGVVVWWFNSDGSRRFDLKGRDGTCYTAATDEGAFIEVFGRTGIVHPADVAARSLAVIRIDTALRLADLRAASAAGFGVTTTVSAGVPYEQHSHPWARALGQAGFDGIRYVLRHDPTGDESGYALFGPGGTSLGDGAAAPRRFTSADASRSRADRSSSLTCSEAPSKPHKPINDSVQW